jgi:hypothetical protein
LTTTELNAVSLAIETPLIMYRRPKSRCVGAINNRKIYRLAYR